MDKRVKAAEKKAFEVKQKIYSWMLKDREMDGLFNILCDYFSETNYYYLDSDLLHILLSIINDNHSSDILDKSEKILTAFLKDKDLGQDLSADPCSYIVFFLLMIKIIKNSVTVQDSGIAKYKRGIKDFIIDTSALTSILIEQKRTDEPRLLLKILEPYLKDCKTRINAPFLSDIAQNYLDIGEYQKCKNLYKTVLKFDPNESTVWKNLGLCYEKLGDKTGAKSCWKKILSLKPTDALKTICDEGRTTVQKCNLRKTQKFAKEKLSQNSQVN